MSALIVERIGPGASVQDLGRRGWLAQGLSRSGAADRLALLEGAALLGQPHDLAALELTGMGGTFHVTAPTRIAFTGAPMSARLDDTPLIWNATHLLIPGSKLTLGPAQTGIWSYLHVGGGIDVPSVMGSRAAHLNFALGVAPKDGAELAIGADPSGATGVGLPMDLRFGGGDIRLLPSAHTALFSQADLDRFTATEFIRDPRGNRQGVRLDHDGAPFASEGQLTLVSEVIVPGDIQMTGDGTPYILGPESQTTGGYPRIASVVPADLPRAMQAAPGDPLRFRFVTLEDALADYREDAAICSALKAKVTPLTRDPHDIADLLAYQLISGVIAGEEDIS